VAIGNHPSRFLIVSVVILFISNNMFKMDLFDIV